MSYSYESYSYSTQEFINNDLPKETNGISFNNDSYSINDSLQDNYVYSGNSTTDLTNGSNQIVNDMVRLMSNSRTNSNTYGTSSTNTTFYNSKPTNSTNEQFLNSIETSILRSHAPININETEEITVLGQRGIWANKNEELNWRGIIPINDYPINDDRNPEIITKKPDQDLEYVQGT